MNNSENKDYIEHFSFHLSCQNKLLSPFSNILLIPISIKGFSIYIPCQNGEKVIVDILLRYLYVIISFYKPYVL